MLYAKISPAAKLVTQDGPFKTITTSAEYVAISAMDYSLGDNPIALMVQYGEPVFQGEKFLFFNAIIRQRLELTPEQLATWGTDDSVVFDIVAQDQNFEIVELLTTPTTTTTTTVA
jgi:hypothetical protein